MEDGCSVSLDIFQALLGKLVFIVQGCIFKYCTENEEKMRDLCEKDI